MSDISNILMRAQDDEISFVAQVLKPNGMWLGSLLIMVLATVYLKDKAASIAGFMKETPDFIIYGEWIASYWPVVCAAVGAIAFLYLYGERQIGAPFRKWLYQGFIYIARDRLFAMEVCNLFAALMKIGESKVGAGLAVRDIYSSHPHRRRALMRVIREIDEGETLAMAMLTGGVLEEKYANYLMTLARSDDQMQIVAAMPMLNVVIREDVRSVFDTHKLIILIAALTPTSFMIYAMMPIFLGTGMDAF